MDGSSQHEDMESDQMGKAFKALGPLHECHLNKIFCFGQEVLGQIYSNPCLQNILCDCFAKCVLDET